MSPCVTKACSVALAVPGEAFGRRDADTRGPGLGAEATPSVAGAVRREGGWWLAWVPQHVAWQGRASGALLSSRVRSMGGLCDTSPGRSPEGSQAHGANPLCGELGWVPQPHLAAH